MSKLKSYVYSYVPSLNEKIDVVKNTKIDDVKENWEKQEIELGGLSFLNYILKNLVILNETENVDISIYDRGSRVSITSDREYNGHHISDAVFFVLYYNSTEVINELIKEAESFGQEQKALQEVACEKSKKSNKWKQKAKKLKKKNKGLEKLNKVLLEKCLISEMQSPYSIKDINFDYGNSLYSKEIK